MTVTPFEAYKKYVALKLHFSNSKYDYFKFNGDVKVSKDSFEKRNDKAFFYRLAKKYKPEELESYLVSNFLDDPQNWIGDIITNEGEDTLAAWQKKMQSLTYNFKQDMVRLHDGDKFDYYFVCDQGQHPYILDIVMGKDDFSIESFIIMNKILNFFPQFDRRIKPDLVWKDFKNQCVKYEPFLKGVDVEKCKKIMKEVFVTVGRVE